MSKFDDFFDKAVEYGEKYVELAEKLADKYVDTIENVFDKMQNSNKDRDR